MVASSVVIVSAAWYTSTSWRRDEFLASYRGQVRRIYAAAFTVSRFDATTRNARRLAFHADALKNRGRKSRNGKPSETAASHVLLTPRRITHSLGSNLSR